MTLQRAGAPCELKISLNLNLFSASYFGPPQGHVQL